MALPQGDPIEAAVAAVSATGAEAVDAVLLVVGTSDDWETEGNDREALNLPGMQDILISRVATAHPKAIVINNSGSPIAMPWLEQTAAVLQTWFPGEEARLNLLGMYKYCDLVLLSGIF